MTASATNNHIKSSVQKVNEIVQLIRRKPVEYAFNQLKLCKRQFLSRELYQLLNSAVANCENNHGMDADRLIVDEVYVGKSTSLKRFRFRARGRVAKVIKSFSTVTILLKENK